MPPRPRYPMPDFMREALEARGLTEAYNERPPYQRNDYNGWITRAKRSEMHEKRLQQMLDELEKEDVQKWIGKRPFNLRSLFHIVSKFQQTYVGKTQSITQHC